MTAEHLDLPQGTLDCLILRTLALGPEHGWAISEGVQQLSSNVQRIQQGPQYPAAVSSLKMETNAWEKLTAAAAQVPGTT